MNPRFETCLFEILFSLFQAQTNIRNDWKYSALMEGCEGGRVLVMEDTEETFVPTLKGQFISFTKLLDWANPTETITLYCSDYWMRQSGIIDDRNVTMTDTGVVWNKFSKSELNWDEWQKYLSEFCVFKELDKLEIELALTNCGLPGTTRVYVPQYRDFFKTYKSKKALIVTESLDSCGKPIKKANKPT